MSTLTARIGAILLGGLLVASSAGAQPASAPASAKSQQTPGASNGRSLPPVAPIEPDYRLSPGDKLRVEVYKDAQLSQSLQVRPDGKVTLPLIGDIIATDLTPIQLRDRIANSLKEYITNPVVTVIVGRTERDLADSRRTGDPEG